MADLEDQLNRPQELKGLPAWEVATPDGKIARNSVVNYRHFMGRVFDFGHLLQLHRVYTAVLSSVVENLEVEGLTGQVHEAIELAGTAEAIDYPPGIIDRVARLPEGGFTKPGELLATIAFLEHYVILPRIPQARDYIREQLGVIVRGDIPLELHRAAHLADAYPKNERVAAIAASGEWAYVLAIVYPKIGPVAGVGFRAKPTASDFLKNRPLAGGEWTDLLALAARTEVAIKATDADTLRILRKLLRTKELRPLVLEPESKRYLYPTSLTPVQRSLTTAPKAGPVEDYGHMRGRYGSIYRYTYSDKVHTQLALEDSNSSLEDASAYILRTVRELGPLTLKVWHAALCFAAEDMNHGLEGGSFWWTPDRLLDLEGMSLHSDNRRNREEKLKLLHEDLWHEVQIPGQGGNLTISGHLITSIELDTTCTLTVGGRSKKWHRVVLHPTIGAEIIRAKREGRFALLDKKWFRLDPAKYPIAVCLYPYLEDQWRRNAQRVARGRRDKWLGLTLRSVAEAAGLDIDPINPGRTRERLRDNLAHLTAEGLIGGWEYSDGENLLEDFLEVWPPEDHEGINALTDKYHSLPASRKGLPAPKK